MWTTSSGVLNRATPSAANHRRHSSTSTRSLPTTKAATRSPSRRSGQPTTTAWRTSG
jgi:hypothetical protein